MTNTTAANRKPTTVIEEPTTVYVPEITIRNFFYSNPTSKTPSISMAFITATTRTTDGKSVTTFTYTNRNMETTPLTAEAFKAKWDEGYFTATPASRVTWFNTEGVLVRTREMVGASRTVVDAPEMPKF